MNTRATNISETSLMIATLIFGILTTMMITLMSQSSKMVFIQMSQDSFIPTSTNNKKLLKSLKQPSQTILSFSLRLKLQQSLNQNIHSERHSLSLCHSQCLNLSNSKSRSRNYSLSLQAHLLRSTCLNIMHKWSPTCPPCQPKNQFMRSQSPRLAFQSSLRSQRFQSLKCQKFRSLPVSQTSSLTMLQSPTSNKWRIHLNHFHSSCLRQSCLPSQSRRFSQIFQPLRSSKRPRVPPKNSSRTS